MQHSDVTSQEPNTREKIGETRDFKEERTTSASRMRQERPGDLIWIVILNNVSFVISRELFWLEM